MATKQKKRAAKKVRKPLPKKVREAASEALKGNGFWKLRSKHGVTALFDDPFKLLESAQEYLQQVESSPLYKSEWKDGALQDIPVRRVASLKGFCSFCDVTEEWWRGFKSSKTFERNKDFGSVMLKIEQFIYNYKYEGAASGFFNANIIARDLGLIDKQDITTAGEKIAVPEFKVYNSAPPLAGDEKNVDSKKK